MSHNPKQLRLIAQILQKHLSYLTRQSHNRGACWKQEWSKYTPVNLALGQAKAEGLQGPVQPVQLSDLVITSFKIKI